MTRAIGSISNFLFEENSIRATVDGATPWFVAKDIASALGIEWRGASTLARIKAAWKGVRKFRTPGGNQELTVINEPAVYKFVFRSNKDQADRFTDWLAGEVLPAIRKTGAYFEDKTIDVREHTRRTSAKVDDAIRLKKNIDRLESVVTSIQPAAQPNFCAMIVDGEPVFVDVNSYAQSGRAVVIGHNGQMRIEHVEPDTIGVRPFGPRTALGERRPGAHGTMVRNSLIVVGMVVDPLERQRQAVVDDVSAKLRGQITVLLESGPWNDQQIAKQLCCNPKLVREVRREQSSKPTDQLSRRLIEHLPNNAPYKDRAIELIRQGYSNLAIARALGCCEETVRRHRVRLVS